MGIFPYGSVSLILLFLWHLFPLPSLQVFPHSTVHSFPHSVRFPNTLHTAFPHPIVHASPTPHTPFHLYLPIPCLYHPYPPLLPFRLSVCQSLVGVMLSCPLHYYLLHSSSRPIPLHSSYIIFFIHIQSLISSTIFIISIAHFTQHLHR